MPGLCTGLWKKGGLPLWSGSAPQPGRGGSGWVGRVRRRVPVSSRGEDDVLRRSLTIYLFAPLEGGLVERIMEGGLERDLERVLKRGL